MLIETVLIEGLLYFAKAFDSVNRVALLGALTAYGCDPATIDIVELYTNDYAEIYKDDVKIGQMEVQIGIWQGCTGSPHLFVLIVKMIIRANYHLANSISIIKNKYPWLQR